MKSLVLVAPFLCTLALGQSGDPKMTTQPNATLQIAPDRTYHLIRATVKYNVDEVHHIVTGTIKHTFSMIESGARRVRFETAVEKISDIRIDGKSAKSYRVGGSLDIEVPNGPVGAVHTLTLRFEGPVFHWFTPTKADPYKAGFYGEGLSALPVAWSFPNDFTSTAIETTLPNAWTVISNGLQVSDKPAGKGRHTVSWNMDQPHANYLTSIVAGPFDIVRDTWRGRPLIMSCPKGYGDRLSYTFGNTKDILSYFSDVLGVTYPWPKYAQTVVYDHPYGMEEVNASIYPMYWSTPRPFLSIANSREGQRPFEWVIAHETAHQWFGDLVTCKDWGHTWLNEGLTTFMEMMYTRHSRGEQESLRQMEAYSQRYFNEFKQYHRPIVTNIFANQGDAHTYYKGGTVLMSLRKMLGDKAFFRGLNKYLKRHYLGNVETNDLIQDMTDASGINLHPWFDQWIFKPGHPIINWSWSFDPIKREVSVRVQQTQDTSAGIPIFNVPTHIAIVTPGGLRRESIRLNDKDQTFVFSGSSSPLTVLFDPDHEFVREISSQPWSSAELVSVFLHGPNPVDGQYALDHLTKTPETTQLMMRELRNDTAPFPAILDTSGLASSTFPNSRAFWMAELGHANYKRRTNAVLGFSMLAKGPEDLVTLHRMMGADQPYSVVAMALRRLAKLDFDLIRLFAEKEARTSPSADVREAAMDVLADEKSKGWIEAILASASDSNITLIRVIGVDALKRIPRDDLRLPAALRSALDSPEPQVVSSAFRAATFLRVKAVLPDLERLRGTSKAGAELEEAIKACSRD